MRIVIGLRTGKLSLDPLSITLFGQMLMARVEHLDQVVPAHGDTPSWPDPSVGRRERGAGEHEQATGSGGECSGGHSHLWPVNRPAAEADARVTLSTQRACL